MATNRTAEIPTPITHAIFRREISAASHGGGAGTSGGGWGSISSAMR